MDRFVGVAAWERIGERPPFKFPCKNLPTDCLLGLRGKACGKADGVLVQQPRLRRVQMEISVAVPVSPASECGGIACPSQSEMRRISSWAEETV